MNYSIIKREESDVPLKGQINVYAKITGDINRDSLETILMEIYDIESQKQGFQYHPFPTHIFIYLYTSQEHYDGGMFQWIARLEKIKKEGELQIFFNESQIDNLYTQPEVIFGLTEQERKKIYQEFILAEGEAMKETDQRYPTNPLESEQVGQSFTLNQEVRLMLTSHEPSTIDELEKSIQSSVPLKKGMEIVVLDIKKDKHKSWYEVEVKQSNNDFPRKGWINAIALVNATYMTSPEQQSSNRMLFENVQKAFKQKLATRYGLTSEQLDKIGVEGLSKNWPFPTRE